MVWGYNMAVITPETLPPVLDYIRERRNALLKACDWTQATDSPLSDEKKAEWAAYRQELRDLPSAYTNSNSFVDIVFPEMPE